MGSYFLVVLVVSPLIGSTLSFLSSPAWARWCGRAGAGLFVLALIGATILFARQGTPLAWTLGVGQGAETLRLDGFSLFFLWLVGATLTIAQLCAGPDEIRGTGNGQRATGNGEQGTGNGILGHWSSVIGHSPRRGDWSSVIRPEGAIGRRGWLLFLVGLCAALLLAGSWSQRVPLALLAALSPLFLVLLNPRAGRETHQGIVVFVLSLMVGVGLLAVGRSEMLPDLQLPAVNEKTRLTVERTVFSIFFSLIGCALLAGIASPRRGPRSVALLLDPPSLLLTHFGGAALAGVYLAGRVVIGRQDDLYLTGRIFRPWPGLSLGEWFLVLCLGAVVSSLVALGRSRSVREMLASLSVTELAYGFCCLGLYVMGSRFALLAWAYLQVGYATAFACAWLGLASLPRTALNAPSLSQAWGEQRENPLARGAIVTGLAALLGLPPFAGFWGKWLMVAALPDDLPIPRWLCLLPFLVQDVMVLRWLVHGPGSATAEDAGGEGQVPERRHRLMDFLLIGTMAVHSAGGLILTWAARWVWG